jgi:hypothetical protein
MDSQSSKTTESGGVRGYDGGKKIKGRKRHALVDTDGRALKIRRLSKDVEATIASAEASSMPLPLSCCYEG